MNPTSNPKDEFVRCYRCKRPYQKLAATIKEQRELATADGWRVAVPEAHMQSLSNYQKWLQEHPDRKHVKVDLCPDCMMEYVRLAAESMSRNRITRESKTIN